MFHTCCSSFFHRKVTDISKPLQGLFIVFLSFSLSNILKNPSNEPFLIEK